MAELAYAAVPKTAERIGLKSRVHVGSNPTAGTILGIVEEKDAASSAREYAFESRCPRQDGLVVQRGGSVACTRGTRIRFSGSTREVVVSRFKTPVPRPGDAGSILVGLATLVLRREGTATFEVS